MVLVLIGYASRYKTAIPGTDLSLSYTYTSNGLDTRLLEQPYRPSQTELFSPAIQNLCRGLIRGLIRGAIFSCRPSPGVDLALEKKQGISAENVKIKKVT